MRSREYHFVHKSGAGQFRQIACPPHHAFSETLLVLQEAANRPAQLRMLLQMTRQSMSQSTRSHNEDVPHSSERSRASRSSFSLGPPPRHYSSPVQNPSDPAHQPLQP